MSARLLLIACAATAVLPASAGAQPGKDRFLRGLEVFVNSLAGTHGDEGPVLRSALADMRAGLAEWDALVANVELRFNAEVASAPPQAAARMRTALGTVYLERGRLDMATAQFEKAASLDPVFADVHALLGAVHDFAGRPALADAAYGRLWRAGATPPAHAYLFYRSLPDTDAAGRGADAVRMLEAAAAQATPPGGPLFATVSAADGAAVGAPLFAPAAYASAIALVRANRFDEAVARLAAALDADPLVRDRGLQDAAVRGAIAAMKESGPGEEAGRALDEAAARLQSAEVYRIAGLFHSQRKQYPEGVERLRLAVRLDPANERARVAMADALVESGDQAGARDVLLETTRVIAASGLAHWKLGRLAQSTGDELEALESFEAASSAPPVAGLSHVLAAIGRLHHNHLDLDAAASVYRRRVGLAPNDPAAHADLGDVERARGSLERASVEFLAAALLDPSSARAFAGIGQLLAAEDRDEAAVAMLRRAIALDADHIEARYALSRALLRLGRAEDARRELEIYERLQARAMEEERRRFRENQAEIDEVLKAAPAGRRP